MIKVQLSKVDEEIRDELRMLKARRKDKGLSETLDFLIAQAERVPELEKENMELKELIKELVKTDEYYRS